MPEQGAFAVWHAGKGGQVPPEPTRQAPVAHHGDRGAEDRALREGVAVWGQDGWGLLRLVGPGRLEFLNKYVTQEVKSLAPGQATYACCLTIKGAMVSDLWVLARADDALVVTPPPGLEPLVKHLGRYAAFAGVKLEDQRATHALLGVAGPGAEAAVTALLGPLPATGHAHQGDVTVARAVGPVAALLLIAARDRALALACALVAAGALPVGDEALEALRVERGVPLFGADMDTSTIPIEAGLEDRAVSYTKGCYLGQEVIARIAHRGHVNRHLVGLRLSGPVAPGELTKDGKAVGSLTTVATSPRLGAIGLGMVHRKHVEPGTTLAVTGGEAIVTSLPF